VESDAISPVRYRSGRLQERYKARTGGSGVDTRYVVNEKGERVGVILGVEEYERLLAALEDLEDLRAADEALAAIERGEENLLPLDEAVEEMEEERRRLREAGKLPGEPQG
jgi:PHD/YefM family antitoxin component YafN of YafNO toxin-antitoxin module